jgi:central glycolytic genes regulator
MDRFFTVLERFAPEAVELIVIRYQILRQVMHQQPVGRRQLVKSLGYTERTVRNEIEVLRERGAIHSTPAGITLGSGGEELLKEIDELIPFLLDIHTLGERLKRELQLREVVLVPGDSRQDPLVKKDLGRAAARYFRRILSPGSIVAVTGGTTLAEMADAISEGGHMADVLVVPARGGLGEEMELQAGSIAAKIAKAIGAQYRLLHIPDVLEEGTAEILRRDIHIAQMVETIRSSTILVHGIGSAIEMANRRGLPPHEVEYLRSHCAVGEALRYYFDGKGNIVYEVPGIGLELSDLERIHTVVAVAGGSNKAQAIKAVLRNRKDTVLITDEGAAKEMLKNHRKG